MEHPSTHISSGDVDVIRKHAAAAEQLGKLTPEQLALVYQRRWFKMLVPAIHDGCETALPETVRIEEALSWADGSLGWVVTLCSGAGWFGGFIHPNVAREVFLHSELCIAGSGAATGTAELVDDGYIINGKWQYASGVHHATHITVNCIIQKDGLPLHGSEGNALIRPFVLERKQVHLLPGWKYMGMIATGSDAYEVNDLKVDANRCFKIEAAAAVIEAPLYSYPFLQLAEATLAANLSGMAVHFVDLCTEIFRGGERNIRQISPANLQVMQEALRANIDLLDSAREAFYTAVNASWPKPNDDRLLVKVSSSSRMLAKIARECVDELYPYCGLQAAAPNAEINRVWRDLHTASQHSLLTFAE